MKAWIKRNFYRIYYHNKNVTFGLKTVLNTKNVFGGNNTIGEKSEIATCIIGSGTYVSDQSILRHTKIGHYCSIGSYVQTGLGTHPSKTFVSTHPAFFSTKKQAGFSFVKNDIFKEQIFIDQQQKYVVEIGNDVWIGNNVIIMDGLKIGDGAIIATGAIVTKDVLPYAIVAGVPAKFVRYRFSDTQIDKLLKIKWWEWDYDTLQSRSGLFSDIDTFIQTFEN